MANPREGMSLNVQRRVIGEGEFVKLTLFDVRTKPVVEIVYPSGWTDTVTWEIFERVTIPMYFGRSTFEEVRYITSYLTNWRKTVYWPDRNRMMIRMRNPKGEEVFV